MNRFNIFVKSKKFSWTINKLMLLLFVLGFVVVQINNNFPSSKYYKAVDKSLMYIFLAAFIGGTIYKVFKIAKPKKLNGKFEGFLEFRMDSVVINQSQFNIDEIEKIEIVNRDFYGNGSGGSGFDSNLSNGVDNYLTLILKNKRKVQCQFEMYNEYDLGKADNELINYYSHGKLDFNQLIRILKVKGEKEIEDFKKFIPATIPNRN